MLSSEWKASLRAWSEGVKYCWRLEDWAEDDPAMPPDQSISRREARTCTGPQLADLSWPRPCEDWGWGDCETDTGQSGTQLVTTREQLNSCVCLMDLRWGEQERGTQVFPARPGPRVMSQSHVRSSYCYHVDTWEKREESPQSPNLVGRESLIASEKVINIWVRRRPLLSRIKSIWLLQINKFKQYGEVTRYL